MISAGVTLFAAAAFSTLAALLFLRLAPLLGVVDHPGGRKEHQRTTPLVGGMAVLATLLVGAWYAGIATAAAYFLVALACVALVGFWDDVAEIRPRIKFAIQIGAAAIMIFGAGVDLDSVGDLLGWRPIGTSFLSIPITIFAIIGVVNAINMMDGMDGLAGSIALVAFTWFAIVAAQSGLTVQAHVALILCGALAGFLALNLRFPWQAHARIFLGDAGSLMLGFALGWFAIDLSQGGGRTFPPIAALYVLLLPLCDCVSLMVRRVRARKSPFVADRSHIHHYLLARGFSHSETLAILVGIAVVSGAVGYFGWVLKVPESVMFWPFFFGFWAYHGWIERAWEEMAKK